MSETGAWAVLPSKVFLPNSGARQPIKDDDGDHDQCTFAMSNNAVDHDDDDDGDDDDDDDLDDDDGDQNRSKVSRVQTGDGGSQSRVNHVLIRPFLWNPATGKTIVLS